MNLFENNVVRISIDPKVPALEWIGKGKMTSEQFRESEEKSLALYRQYKNQYPGMQWYVDARNVGALANEDLQWVTSNILPEFAKEGLKKEAFVIPTSSLGKLTIRNYKNKATGRTIEIEMFDSEDKAKNWLKK